MKKESFIERFIPEKMYINGDAGDGKLEACRKIGGNYEGEVDEKEGLPK
ncbi:hypothetical protein L195_g024664 [Trifolium pratense]|uniref:Uncharacterized protein n=1 Tax=Trifolium pratense TaxID=57577 RepID=A0A2K3LWU4_TRIPR|nr:hypothetical protein L195_g039030 [Trifolium pratense]PNX83552.1 hypothetical protein L195_g039596 [Trifolium pratense]PNY01372.1 hypothetical protein L195_g024664 [Trifolium pratense]